MGKADSWDTSYCGFDCGNTKCSRNQANIPGKVPKTLWFTMFEECKEYQVKPGLDAKGVPYVAQDLAKLQAVAEARKGEVLKKVMEAEKDV